MNKRNFIKSLLSLVPATIIGDKLLLEGCELTSKDIPLAVDINDGGQGINLLQVSGFVSLERIGRWRHDSQIDNFKKQGRKNINKKA